MCCNYKYYKAAAETMFEKCSTPVLQKFIRGTYWHSDGIAFWRNTQLNTFFLYSFHFCQDTEPKDYSLLKNLQKVKKKDFCNNGWSVVEWNNEMFAAYMLN